ncbi:hypothetical protein EXN66_Car004341 [Channa argus]|uniref:Uncharacterized protein n=1 Tax=Channa argus TaxID=215402 RepID=A0A6G1PEN3_CHAAH|nr:hypothetical protein EXN66_Car004341 [Channa argus]
MTSSRICRETESSNQVLEESFHCVTSWHHPGLPALPSAAVKHQITDNISATELLQRGVEAFFPA